ncbi:uncharacterized protein LOC132085517 [Ammospiza nelsoni]|uniref:uncharacterized protein LOC132085517 n=1 Tax=Ammospiza nelsoni TaxID=2857394 RepID=UPI00286C0A43|nr:uncharacterized protein LOC132085517 [Ammospiza nelsoni]
MEPLEPQVTVVATLGELLNTLPRLDEMMLVNQSASCLYWDLVDFTKELQTTLYCTDATGWRHNVTSDDGDPPAYLSWALAAYRSTPGTSRDRVTMAASEWQESVSVFMNSWAHPTRTATKLRNTCRVMAIQAAAEAAESQAHAASWAKHLQDEAQENMRELGQALGREEGAEGRDEQKSWKRRYARKVAREATRATRFKERVEASLWLLERLVAACDEASAFPRELQHLLRDIKAILEGTNAASPDVLGGFVAKVAVAEALWEANARLAKDHLLGTLPDTTRFYMNGAPTGPSTREVAERCQRATEDIPRLLRPMEHLQSVLKVSPVSVELQELSPALLQPPVTVMVTLGELLATLPRRDEMILPVSTMNLYFDLVEFTKELRVTLYRIDDTSWHLSVTSNIDDPPTSLSQALTACKSTPGTTWDCVTMAASKWHRSVSTLMDSWAQMASKATKLRNACREVVTEADTKAATATARARELQDEAARYGTAQENMVELGEAVGREEGAEVVAGHEAWVREHAMMAASEATRATMVRERVEAALGLLERLVAACDEATTFPRELQRRVGDIEAALKGTNEASHYVPEYLVAKVAVAEQLWVANARLAKEHLRGTLDDISKFYFDGEPVSLNVCEVAERCQRATEDIPRLLRPPEHPQSVPRVSSVTMELQKLSPALLQPQVTVVAIMGELLGTLPRENEAHLVSAVDLYFRLADFSRGLWATLYCIDNAGWRHSVICEDGDPFTSLSQALADYKDTTWTTMFHVTMAARKWQGSVDALWNCWDQLARKATKLRNICRRAVTEAAYMVAQYRERQAKARENMVELGQTLGREDGAEVVTGHEAQVRREVWKDASLATRATMVRQRMEAALGLLERLVAACEDATAFPRELLRLLRETKAILKGTNEASPNVPEDLVAKVAMAEALWEANARLAKDHLGGTVQDIKFYFTGGPTSPSVCGVAEQCQRAIEDISRLLRPLEHPQNVPKVSPANMEPQELSPAMLQPQVTVVATLGELLDALPRLDKEVLPVSALRLYWGLEEFTRELRYTLCHTDDTWWCRNVTSDGDDSVTSLSQALAAYRSTPGTTWDNVARACSEWLDSVAALDERWADLAWDASKLRNACRSVAAEAADRAATTTAWARELQAKAGHEETAQENMVELGQALGREEGAEVVAEREAQVRREAKVAASEATRATMVREWVEAALGPLERLVAACDEATAFPRELSCLLRDMMDTPEETNEEYPDVPENLVAKVAEAELLWEANAGLGKDHLQGTLQDIIKFYFTGGPDSPSACGVAERCQRAMEDIPRLLQPPECPQGVPKVSPMSMELQKWSPLQLLEALVSVVATLDKVVATVTEPQWDLQRCVPPKSLHASLGRFTSRLRDTLNHSDVTSLGNSGVPSLRRALAALGATPGTTRASVRAAASAWGELVAKLVDSWDQLAREATRICDACKNMVTEQQVMVVPDKEEVPREMATHNAQVAAATNEAEGEATVATRRVMVATWRGHWAVGALGPLQRLVATCDRVTLFYWNMEWQLRDIEATLKGTNKVSPDVLQASVSKVAEFEQLWDASTRLAKDHLLGTLGVIDNLLLNPDGGHGVLGFFGRFKVSERCRKAIEDIPRLLQGQ